MEISLFNAEKQNGVRSKRTQSMISDHRSNWIYRSDLLPREEFKLIIYNKKRLPTLRIYPIPGGEGRGGGGRGGRGHVFRGGGHIFRPPQKV